MSHRDWIIARDDLPNADDLLRATNPMDESRWVNVRGLFRWTQPYPVDVESYDVDKRTIWLSSTGYCLHREDSEAFIHWAKTADLWDISLPESYELDDIFLGEYPWSPAFRYYNQPYYGMEDWTKPEEGCPVRVCIMTYGYSKGSGGFDCSIEDGYLLQLPTRDLVEKLHLCWSGSRADYMDRNGQLAVFDPTSDKEGPTALLIREDVLKQYLLENEMVLCWIITGEKTVHANRQSGMKYYGSLRISAASILEEGRLKTYPRYCHQDRPKR